VQLAATTAFAALTALGARVQFHLPFTPVPVTGQVFCVLLAGGALGARLGFVSQVGYLGLGAAGAPVFAHGGGPAALLGPTAGYLVGFPIAAFVVGALSRQVDRPGGYAPVLPGPPWRLVHGGPGHWRALGASLCGVAVIHAFGAAWLGVWSAGTGTASGLASVLTASLFPFVGVDLAKALLACVVFPGLRRRLWLA
jgi:biotin transport system substrate-specific component